MPLLIYIENQTTGSIGLTKNNFKVQYFKSPTNFEFSKHALDQSIIRRICLEEIHEVIASGEIIEDYPEDKYGPSCLILGFTQAKRPLIQCSYPSRSLIKIIPENNS